VRKKCSLHTAPLGNPTVDVSPTISVRTLFKGQRLRPGLHAWGRLNWNWTYTNEPMFSTEFEAWLNETGGRARFRHGSLRHGESSYFVSLVTRPQPFGGLRWWFLCPRSGRRVAKLHMPLGAYQFASRKAYRLPYHSQRADSRERLRSRATKMRRRLGDAEGDVGDDITKPKWMRWRTFERKADKLFAMEEASEAAWAGFIGAFLQRYGSGAK
jgi:hypothetical protein